MPVGRKPDVELDAAAATGDGARDAEARRAAREQRRRAREQGERGRPGRRLLRTPRRREPRGRRTVTPGTAADWLIGTGAAAVVLSLLLPWSHQFSAVVLSRYGSSALLRGVPRDPTAWQVYSIVDVLLAALAAGLLLAALAGGRGARLVAGAALVPALAFVAHALAVPPTNGANIVDPADPARYLPNAPGSGPGELLAIAGLALAAIGLGLSLARR